jgi:hypothetical protein
MNFSPVLSAAEWKKPKIYAASLKMMDNVTENHFL